MILQNNHIYIYYIYVYRLISFFFSTRINGKPVILVDIQTDGRPWISNVPAKTIRKTYNSLP